MLRGVGDETAGPVPLHTSDDVVRIRLDTLRDDTEAVILHDGAAADTAEEALLDTLLEFDDSDPGRGSGDLDRNLADRGPRDANTVSGCEVRITQHRRWQLDLQDCDEERIPELLSSGEVVAVAVEGSGGGVVAVRKADEDPDHDNRAPASKTVVALEEAVSVYISN